MNLTAQVLYHKEINKNAPVVGGSSGGAGTVISVDISMPAIFSVSGNPITTSGTLAISLANQNANLVWAGPASGSAAAPTFRVLDPADIPTPVMAASRIFAAMGFR
jgi:hypothetical protein